MTEELTGSRRSSRSTLRGSPFPPIAEYGFLSDCEVSALIAASGTVEWMCLPRMDSPSVFAAILDRGAGWFRLGPADVTVPAGRAIYPGRWCWRRRGPHREAGPWSVTSCWSDRGAMIHSDRVPTPGCPLITARNGCCCEPYGA